MLLVFSIYTAHNIQKFIEFLYGTVGYPSISTLITAVKKYYFVTWIGLTVNKISKYLYNYIVKQWPTQIENNGLSRGAVAIPPSGWTPFSGNPAAS